MVPYPKIETLYKRTEDFKVNTSQIRCEEFTMLNKWYVTEKLDGQNIRIEFDCDNDTVKFAGRSEAADLHKDLISYLEKTFLVPDWKNIFSTTGTVELYGEGIGPGIQKGSNLSKEKSFVLFDVRIGHWWLEPEDVKNIAKQFNIQYVPEFGFMNMLEIVELVRNGFNSLLAKQNTGTDHPAEGIIAKAKPGLKFRNGARLMFKLKHSDF